MSASMVSSTRLAVDQTIVLAKEYNPTQIMGLDKLLPQIQQMLDHFVKTFHQQ